MILVSACLTGVCCKYSGGNNYNKKVMEYLQDKEYICVCPERDGGLPTPRVPSERLGDRVINKEGVDVTEEFTRGAQIALDTAKENGITLALLKARSPSCGYREIYDGSFTGTLIPGMGVCAGLLTENNIKIISEEDL